MFMDSMILHLGRTTQSIIWFVNLCLTTTFSWFCDLSVNYDKKRKINSTFLSILPLWFPSILSCFCHFAMFDLCSTMYHLSWAHSRRKPAPGLVKSMDDLLSSLVKPTQTHSCMSAGSRVCWVKCCDFQTWQTLQGSCSTI